MLETEIKKLTAAIEANTVALLGGAQTTEKTSSPTPAEKPAKTEAKAPAKTEAKAPAEKPEADVPTVEDLRQAGNVLVQAGKIADLKAILSKYGAAAITKVPEDARAAVLAAINAAASDEGSSEGLLD